MSNHYASYNAPQGPPPAHGFVGQGQQQYGGTAPQNGYNMPARPGPAYGPQSNMPSSHSDHSPDGKYTKQTMTPEERAALKKRKLIIYAGLAVLIAITVLFLHYKDDFERWVQPLEDWLRDRESWSWLIPVALLVLLSFPPLFGGEIVQLIVGLTYPLGVAIGIACAGSILGEAACFIVFKFFFTNKVQEKIRKSVKWAAITRVTQEAGWKGVLVIRYSMVPPHLANPLFACTGMSFFLYMATVVASLPKGIVFVALGTKESENSQVGKWCKIIAIVILTLITIVATKWMRKKQIIAQRQIEAERAGQLGNDEEHGLVDPSRPSRAETDTSYTGAYR